MSQTLETLLASFPEEKLREIQGFWDGVGPRQLTKDELPSFLKGRMTNSQVLVHKTKELGRKLNDLLLLFLHARNYRMFTAEIEQRRPLSIPSSYEMDVALTALVRRGFLFSFTTEQAVKGFAIPKEIGDSLLAQLQFEKRGLHETFTLKGFLEKTGSPERSNHANHHLRETYRLLSEENALLSRVSHLPPETRELVEKVILVFGGILPKSLFDRLSLGPMSWEKELWKNTLEQSCLGTVTKLSLERYGIHHDEETLVIFNEASLAYLRAHSLKRKRSPGSAVEMGVDLVSNVDRFITFVLENPVKFTMRGEIFRTTEKRIAEDFLKISCRELPSKEMLDWIYRFALDFHLIDRTGERTFALSQQGIEWKSSSLNKKLHTLLKYACEERDLPGEYGHHLQLRQFLLRWIRRLEPGKWYDAMALPLLARNTYLSGLDQAETSELGPPRQNNNTAHPSMEDLQQMAWNLFAWLRRRLHPLGVVDLSYDSSGRPVLLRLSQMGAQLLAIRETKTTSHSQAHVVVNPDFEAVLFPTEDSFEMIHAMDRFCIRTKSDRLYHYRLTEESVCRALSEGIALTELIRTLQKYSRVPIPQNVIYSIRDWALKVGTMKLGKRNHLLASRPDVLNRFLSDTRSKNQLSSRLSETEAVMKRNLKSQALRQLILELGFFVDEDERS